MFNKKSEEQEWTRFRGALAKDREEPASEGHEGAAAVPAAPAAAPGPPAGAPSSPSGPSFRPSPGDVNVTVPTRTSRPSSNDSQDVESLIGERTTFEGTFKAEGAVRVLGNVNGELESKGAIYIDERAHVTARVTAGQVTVAGKVDGQIYSQGRVEIRPTGRVTGEIHATALIIQEGALFDGASKMASGVGQPGGGTAAPPATAAHEPAAAGGGPRR